MTMRELYRQSGIIYILYDREVETNPNGQTMLTGSRPRFSQIYDQIEYGEGSGKFLWFVIGTCISTT